MKVQQSRHLSAALVVAVVVDTAKVVAVVVDTAKVVAIVDDTTKSVAVVNVVVARAYFFEMVDTVLFIGVITDADATADAFVVVAA